VFQQYIDFFSREPDAGEVSPWVSALDRGLSKADLIEVFMDSEEFRFEGKFITQTYLGILTRDADYAGFRGWLGTSPQLLFWRQYGIECGYHRHSRAPLLRSDDACLCRHGFCSQTKQEPENQAL